MLSRLSDILRWTIEKCFQFFIIVKFLSCSVQSWGRGICFFFFRFGGLGGGGGGEEYVFANLLVQA